MPAVPMLWLVLRGSNWSRCCRTYNCTEALEGCGNCEILLIRTNNIFAELVVAMPRLGLIQALTTCTDHIEGVPNLPSHVLVAAARGFPGPPLPELAFLFMLAFTRRFLTVLKNQRQHKWDRRQQRLLAGRTAAIVGVGRVAGELAQRCRAFGMRVVGVSSRSTAPGFETLYSRACITDAAREADFMIALAPYTRENHHWSIAPLSTP